jgi:peroxiredoxin
MEDTQERPVALKDYLGRKVLLSCTRSPGPASCTDQMRALEANWDRFQALNTVPLGISVDPSQGKKAWAAVLCIKNVPLLSDFWPHGKVARDYGIFHEEFGMSERANIIVNEKGVVQWVKVYPMGELPDIEEVFKELSK